MKYIILIITIFTTQLHCQELSGKLDRDLRTYTTIDNSIVIKIPENVSLDRLRDAKDEGGITNQVIMEDANKQLYGVVTTKIRPEFPKTDEILLRTASRFRSHCASEDGSNVEYVSMEKCGEKSMLTAIVRHIGKGKPFTFYDKWLKKNNQYPSDYIEARVYVVLNGYFVEFKRIGCVETMFSPKKLNENDYSKKLIADSILLAYNSSAMNLKERDCLLAATKSAELIRGLFEDPSIDEKSK